MLLPNVNNLTTTLFGLYDRLATQQQLLVAMTVYMLFMEELQHSTMGSHRHLSHCRSHTRGTQ